MNSSEIRQTFLDFFSHRNHTPLPSSSLVPVNDPSLLFTNAGMVPFKETFLGQEQRPYSRACTIQKCMRVSGKHNDLETVGASSYHHTFFEMLGNFSFGDYFKHDAIATAWQLLTQEYRLPLERLWITVHTDDDESARIWEEIGVDRQRILRFGDKDNFWSMGDTGPCGHSSEIHYYMGRDMHAQSQDGINSDNQDYVELWNLVFMQYNRDEQGTLIPLSKPAVDTGMGLERLAIILQDVKSSYQTDLFQPIIQRISNLLGAGRHSYRQHTIAYNTIADHSRAIAFLIADGVRPGNGGRDYVLRRIIRRASYVGKTLGFDRPFLASITDSVIDIMQAEYPELERERKAINEITIAEEGRFHRTLSKGLGYLTLVMEQLETNNSAVMSGHEAFKLHDTYGFPLDLTQKILAERNLSTNVEEYEADRREHQLRSRAARRLS